MRTDLSLSIGLRTSAPGHALRVTTPYAIAFLLALAPPMVTADLVQKATLTGSATRDEFGFQTVMSDDGTVLAVLGWNDPSSSCLTAWRRGADVGQWTSQPVGSYQKCFRSKIALAHDGKLIAIARPGQEIVALHVATGTGWPLVQTIPEPKQKQKTPHTFASMVALSGDGTTMLTGAPSHPGGTAYVHIFEKQGNAWALQQTLQIPDLYVHAGFAHWLALSHDGNTAVVKAGGKSVRVFSRSADTWAQTAVLAPPDLPPSQLDDLGRYLAISDDGNVIAVETVTESRPYPISLDLFARQGAGWAWRQSLIPKVNEKSHPVYPPPAAIGLSADGETALLGISNTQCHNGAGRCGIALVFEWNGAQWVQTQLINTPPPANSHYAFGHDVALSADAQTAAVGMPGFPAMKPGGSVLIYADGPNPCAGPVINPNCLVFEPPTLQDPSLYLGCAIIDCCELCPGPIFQVNWIIRVDGAPFEEVVLRFDNLDPALARGLKVSGPARWTAPNLLAVTGRADVSIRGFEVTGRANLRALRVSPTATRVRIETVATGARASKSQVAADMRDTVRVRVSQYVDDEQISSGTLLYTVR